MTCAGCVSLRHGGCVHPMSAMGFDEEPRCCDLFYPLEAPKGNPGLLPVKRPGLPPRSDALDSYLGELQREHAPRVWGHRPTTYADRSSRD